MTDPRRLVSPGGQLLLEQVGRSRGTALLAGDLHALRPLVAAHDWPTHETLTGLGAALSQSTRDADTPFLVVAADTGQVVGDCGWKSGPGPDGRAEIGYGLAPSARGLGLGSELVRTLTRWALAEPGCTAVVAEVLADNLPSRRALERASFVIDHIEGPYVWYRRSEA